MKSSRSATAYSFFIAFTLALTACAAPEPSPLPTAEPAVPSVEVEYTLGTENTHNRWSSAIPPALTVPSGAIVEI